LFTKYVFPYFQQFLAKMALKMLRINNIGSEFFSQNRAIWVLKDPSFYAKLLAKNLFLGTFFQARNMFFGNNFAF
jgi:hypothetical protein